MNQYIYKLPFERLCGNGKSTSIDLKHRKSRGFISWNRLILNRWSAVVRGAALHGIEKARLKNYVTAGRYPYFCGIAQDREEWPGLDKNQFKDPVTGRILGKNRLSWVVYRGDLALSSPFECQETLLSFNFREHDQRNFTISIHAYREEDDFLPTRVRENDPGTCPTLLQWLHFTHMLRIGLYIVYSH